MDFSPLPVTSVIGAFLLAFPALFSIVNPIGASLIFNEVTGDLSRDDRARLATRISFYSLLVLLVSLWLGSYILSFFGISLGALRVAGGLVVAIRAWGLLMAPEIQEGRKADDAALAKGSHDHVAFFPLTMPFTTGPGTISVAIALSSQRPTDGPGTASFFIGASVAAVCMAAVIWLSYRSADRLLKLIGANGARVVSRLVALLLLCIGVQIISTGLESLLGPLIRGEVS